jgi:hypothetical protein
LLRRLVIETLTEVEPGRKCFRMVGGVLVERTVAEVLPALQKNVESVSLFLSLYSLNSGLNAIIYGILVDLFLQLKLI